MIIYCITNLINNKKYIGQTRFSLEHRWKQHLQDAKSGLDRKFYCAIRKYGEHSFKTEVLCCCSSLEELNEMETYYIKLFDTVRKGYNYGYGGTENVMDDTQVQEKHLNRMRSPEVRSKISNTMKRIISERGFTKEHRRKISQSMQGNQNGKGQIQTQEHIEARNRSHYKPVYCLNSEFEVVKEFQCNRDGALWWHTQPECEHYKDITSLKDNIKKSYTEKKFVKGLLWVYGTPCVETIETIKKGVE